MPRLFVALRPSRRQRGALLALTSGVPGARWQDDEQLHVTLRFLGEVDRHVAADVDAALAQVSAPPVPIALRSVGCFERVGRPESLWAGVAPDPALLQLHRAIDRAMVRVGLPPEKRAYRPHVTLARCGRRGCPADDWLARYAGLSLPAEAVGDFLLVESTLGGEGARYETVARYLLHDR